MAHGEFPQKPLAQTFQTLAMHLRVLGHGVQRILAVASGKPRTSEGFQWGAFALGSAMVGAMQLHYGLRCDMPPQFTWGKAQELNFQSILKSQGIPYRTQIRMHSNAATAAKTDIRIVDIIDGNNTYHEVKSGSVKWCQATSDQIGKDGAILQNSPDCENYVWHFFPGRDGKIHVDQKVIEKLKANKIQYEFHHNSTDEAVKKALADSNKKIMEGAKIEGKLEGTSQVKAAVKQAQILKAIGAINLAVSLLSLGVATYLRSNISELQEQVPEVEKECQEFLSSVEKLGRLLSEMLARPNELENRKCEIKREFVALKERFEKVKDRCNSIIERAERQRDRSEATKIVSSCTALIGLLVTVASMGCDCGAGIAMGLTSMGTGVAGAVISAGNIERCKQTLSKMHSQVENVTSKYNSVEEQYRELMKVLEVSLHCHLGGAVWRVHSWAHSTYSRIYSIGREDSLDLLKHVGGGCVLGAKGQEVMIGNFNGTGNISLCQIQNIWSILNGMYEADVQCSSELRF